MSHLPLLLDLQGKKCLIIGAGTVGKRKTSLLLDCGAEDILVVDPNQSSEVFQKSISHPAVTFVQRSFSPADLKGVSLVIASSSDYKLNLDISRICEKENILCNIVDAPELGSFIVPALHKQGELMISVSTSGSSPAMAKRIKDELAKIYGPEYELWLKILSRVRSLVFKYGYPTQENTRIFRSLVQEDIYLAIKTKDKLQLSQLLHQKLPNSLHHAIRGLINDLFDPI